MKKSLLRTTTVAGAIAAISLAGTQPVLAQDGPSKVMTYAGEIQFQGQSITKETADFLHRRILEQRASQLVTWAMSMMNFETLYPALLSNMKTSNGKDFAEEDIFFGLYDGYEGVYPFMTANVTTPYTIALSDLSKTGPIVLDLPPGAIYGVIDNAWMQPIHEIDGTPGKLLMVGPGQDYPGRF